MKSASVDRVFVFIDDEVSLSVSTEAPRFKAVEQGKRLAEKSGLRCVPITARRGDGSPITDVAVLAEMISSAIESNPTVALVVDVIQHKHPRKGLEILEHLRRSNPKILEALRGIVLWSKDSSLRKEVGLLAEWFPKQKTAVLDRITQFDELVAFLQSL